MGAFRRSESMLISVVLASLLISQASSSDECNALNYHDNPKKTLCVCRGADCHDLKLQWPSKSGDAVVVTSSKAGKRFKVTDFAQSNPIDFDGTQHIRIDLNSEQQTVLGWGGAITDAAALNYNNLSEPLKDKLVESYFGENGLQYNIGRIPIGGSDFSARSYTYDDHPESDLELKHWTLAPEDLEAKIPMAKRARELAQQLGTDLKLFASPWSPPRWMKQNKKLVRGHLIDTDEVYRSYAEYLMKFYDAYEKEGVRFWGATIQNEPVAANLPFYFFNSLQMSTQETIRFVSKYLGPALEARGYTKDKFKLIVGDDSLGFVNSLVSGVMAEPEAAKYISGLAFHWYTSGLVRPYDSLDSLYRPLKNKFEFLMMSEACTGSNPMDTKVDLGSWKRGALYASDIIEDFRRGTGAWIDWNLALDMGGGPNWSGNFVDSPIIVNAEKQEFYKQPMYYALAHFSRLFRPGAVMVEAKVRPSRFSVHEKLMVLAAKSRDSGHVSVTILNRSRSSRRVRVAIAGLDNRMRKFVLPLDASSITSVLIKQ